MISPLRQYPSHPPTPCSSCSAWVWSGCARLRRREEPKSYCSSLVWDPRRWERERLNIQLFKPEHGIILVKQMSTLVFGTICSFFHVQIFHCYGMRCCRSYWPGLCLFVVINPRMLSANRVDLGSLCFMNFPILLPPRLTSLLPLWSVRLLQPLPTTSTPVGFIPLSSLRHLQCSLYLEALDRASIPLLFLQNYTSLLRSLLYPIVTKLLSLIIPRITCDTPPPHYTPGFSIIHSTPLPRIP